MATRDGFLDRLTGRWELRGFMGETPLHQAVESHWVLGDQFVEMQFRELDGTPYEATYLVGHDHKADNYVLILADSTGVYSDRGAVVGIGQREGEAVTFGFGVARTNFRNRFEWDAAEGAWTHELTAVTEDGTDRAFATKRLTRA